MDTTREGGLLAWQFREYPKGHRDRRNLIVHAATAPLFVAGTCALLLAPFSGAWLLAAALPAMVLPLALQGRTHRRETVAPAAFRGPVDVALRLFLEQWITFPRFVLSGGFAASWRAATASAGHGAAPTGTGLRR